MKLMKPTLQRIVALRCILGDVALRLLSMRSTLPTFLELVRFEVFNLFNTPHFAIPVNALNRPGFGALCESMAHGNVGHGSSGPRLIQIGAR